MEFYAAERKKELIPFSTAWMKLESIMLSEISQVVKDKYHMISLIRGTSSTTTTTKQASKYNQRHEIKNKLTITRGRVGRGIMGKSRGSLHIGQGDGPLAKDRRVGG